jgi:hypothetical protein
MKKTIPAVWFQNKLDPAPATGKKPEVLELFEAELSKVTGGLRPVDSTTYAGSPPTPSDTAD